MSQISRQDLRADCANCLGLCCTALGFTRSPEFAADKPPGTPCGNLAEDFSCGIHARLVERGYRGCTVFDCFGAGQLVSRRQRERPQPGKAMFDAFQAALRRQELRWYLVEACERGYDPAPAEELLAALDADDPDLEALQGQVRAVLMEVSTQIRASYFGEPDHRLVPGADLAGVDLRAVNLVAADLRGACLIGADLRGADLTAVDLLGADLRDAQVQGTDLERALFLTQQQVNAARRDSATRLPVALGQPSISAVSAKR